MSDLWILLALVLAGAAAFLFRVALFAGDRDFLREDEELIEALHGLERVYRGVPAKW